MVNYNELKPGIFFIYEGQPYVVVQFDFLRMQQRKPVAQVKMKNLISGKVIEKNFQNSEKFEEAEIEAKSIKFLYASKPARNASRSDAGGGDYWFSETNDQSKRFSLSADVIGSSGDLIKTNSEIEAVVFEEKIIGVKLPIKVDLKVTEAPPSIKGNTAQGGTKQVKLETGAVVNVPLFINEGDVVRINTETHEYAERAK